MTRAVFQSYAQDNEGNVLPNASVTVIDEDSGSPVSLFNAYSGGSSLSNPFTADANGFFVFYADPARVKITVTLGGDTSEFRNVRLSGTAAQADLTTSSTDEAGAQRAEDLNRFTWGSTVDGILSFGHGLDSNRAIFPFYGDWGDIPTSLTIASTFEVEQPDGTFVKSGITSADIDISSTTISTKVVLLIVDNLTGLITDNAPYRLRMDSPTSEIEIK